MTYSKASKAIGKPRILIVGNLHSNPSCEAFLRKFLMVIYALSDNIVLISGDLPSNFNNRIKWIRTEVTSGVDGELTLLRCISYFISHIRVAAIMARMYLNAEFDMVIFLSPQPLPALFSKMAGIKIVKYQGGIYSNQIFNKGKFRRLLLRLALEELPLLLSDKIIIESNSCIGFQDMKKYASKIMVTRLYVDSQIFVYTKKMKDRDQVIGFASALNENKGIIEFCESLALLRDYLIEKNVKVLIAGDGPLLNSAKEIIKSSRLSDKVTFKGWMPYDKLSDTLNNMRLLVLPFKSEGLPNIVMEAIFCGTPVLTTPVGGLPDWLKNGETGFMMDDTTPEGIAENIMMILEHSDLDYVSSNALSRLYKEFTYDAAVQRYKRLFEDLC